MMKKTLLLLLLACLILPSPAFSEAPEASPAPQAQPSLLELGGNLVLVNRGNRISKTYVPNSLVLPKVPTRKKSIQEKIYLQQQAATALEAMFEAAMIEAGYTLYAASGYRSYGIQQILFNGKVDEVGSKEKAQARVAPAGSSEHQLGLAMDIQAPSHLNLSQAFGSTEEGKWAGENAHRFGFILRYKKEWRQITGVSDEPWHFRFVGIAHATAMKLLDIPLETYVAQAALLPEYVLNGASHVLLAGLMEEMLAGQQPEALEALKNATPEAREEALRQATLPYLKEGESYEQALWLAYPSPKPTAKPWVDEDEEEVAIGGSGNP